MGVVMVEVAAVLSAQWDRKVRPGLPDLRVQPDRRVLRELMAHRVPLDRKEDKAILDPQVSALVTSRAPRLITRRRASSGSIPTPTR